MKYSIFIITTFTLIAAFALSGCDRPSNKSDNAETSVMESNRNMESNRDMNVANREVEAELREFRSENENRLVEHNRTMEEIKQKIENEPDRETKARLETKLNEYEPTHRELKREMSNYKVSGKENWEDFKDSFSNRMDDLGDSLKDFFSSSRTTSSTIQQ